MVIMASCIAYGCVSTTATDAQHGGHTPANSDRDMQPWLIAYIFDIRGHSCYGQLTSVKKRYLLTSIT